MLEIDQVTLAYGATPVVHALSLTLGQGQIGCLLGPSGCGKTTLLRAVAGFEPVAAGAIRIAGRQVADVRQHVPPQARGIGMVFQDHALFPHLDVAGNVGFGLERMDAGQRRARVAEMLALVGLQGMERRWPHALSGGQQQRIALARALAPRPALLLMDEPFSNLDAGLRASLARDVRAILREAGATALLVTHDQHEAFAIADQVGVMAAGRLHQWADPVRIYQQPASAEVALFVGEGVLLPARRCADGWNTELGLLPATQPSVNGVEGAEGAEGASVLLRPESLALDHGAPLRARVRDRVFRGDAFLYTLELASGRRVLALGGLQRVYEPGEDAGLRVARGTAQPA